LRPRRCRRLLLLLLLLLQRLQPVRLPPVSDQSRGFLPGC